MKTSKRFIAAVLVLVFFLQIPNLAISGVATTWSALKAGRTGIMGADEKAALQSVNVNGDSVSLLLSDGREISSWEGYREAVEAGEVSFVPSDVMIRVEAPKTESQSLAAPGWIFWVGDYKVRMSHERGWVRGCINREAMHFGFAVSKAKIVKGVKLGESELANLHIPYWKDAGRLCVGFYESQSRWCTKLCTPTYPDIFNKILAAFIAAGIAYVVAYAIAQVIAPVVFVAILLI